jgi:hypothetical protein
MKTLITLILLIVVMTASAGNFFSYVIKPSDQSTRITVPNKRYIKILTFTAEGPTDCTQIPGTFSQSCNVPTIKAQIGGQPAVTLMQGTAIPAGQEIYVVGPAYVTVTTNGTQTLFLTTFQDSN